MSYLLDTNVVSEVRKRKRCQPNVAAWYSDVEDRDLYLSVLVLGEIRRGIERARHRDATKAAALEDWLRTLTTHFAERILPVDEPVADEWGRMTSQRTFPVIDSLQAATAKIYDLTLVTRNVQDLAGVDVRLLDPFEYRAS